MFEEELEEMVHLLLIVIYLAFIGLVLPDSLLGSAWPSMYGEFGVPVSFAGIMGSEYLEAGIYSGRFSLGQGIAARIS